jgi:hypothetical protein
MKTLLSRIKLSLILTWAIYLPAIWILGLSSSPLLVSMGWPKLAGWGLLMSFGAAHAITLYISAIRQSDEHDKQ